MVLRKRADMYGELLRRLLSRSIAIATAASVLTVALPARAGGGLTLSPSLNAKLDRLYLTAYDETIQRHAALQRDGTTYVSTGDIDSEWLRDASAIVRPYIGLSEHDRDVQQTLRGVVARQARYILIDPYANAFSRDYKVTERKFEVDSLLYPIWFASDYYHQTGDRSIFTPTVRAAFVKVLETLRTEQHHPQRSRYTDPQLANGGHGSPVRYTGMVWTAFRPSDDPVRYHFNIPVNMFAVVVMRDLSSLAREVWHDDRLAENAWGISVEIQRGIEQWGTLDLKPFGRIYPYFFSGTYAQGIGSPHTPHGYVWPLALCVQALTATDEAEVARVFGYIAASDVGDDRLHESFNANWPEKFTRADFAWPNALYAELVLSRRGLLYAQTPLVGPAAANP